MASFTGLKNVGEDVLEYMMKHRPWPDEELSAGLHDLDNFFPGIYGRHASDYKTFADDPRIDAQSLKVINSVRGNPEAMVDIYRAVAAEPFIAYGMDKAGNWLGDKVNGLLGYFGWGE